MKSLYLKLFVFLFLGLCCICSMVGLGVYSVYQFNKTFQENLQSPSEFSRMLEEDNKETDDEKFNNTKKSTEIVNVEGAIWQILEVKDYGTEVIESLYAPYGSSCDPEGGRFIYVKLKIRNERTVPIEIFSFNLYDSNKIKYTSSYELSGCVDMDVTYFENVNPGLEKTVTLTFIVGKESKDLRLKAEDSDINVLDYEYIYL